MSRTVSVGLLHAMELIRTEKMSPWAAAKAARIEDTTVYRSSLYLDYLNETDGPVKAADGMARLLSSRAWGGDRADVTPQSVAKELAIPVQLLYNTDAFQAKVLGLIESGSSIDEVSKALNIPTAAIQKLPRYRERLADERLKQALSMLDAERHGGKAMSPQDVAKTLKISVNLIYHSDQFQKRVLERLKAGVPLRQISEQLGIGHRAIKELPVYAGFERLPGRPSAKKAA